MRVYYGRRSQPSGVLLERALRHADYTGRDINFGYAGGVGINDNCQRYNKRTALLKMREAGVLTPQVYDGDIVYPCVGRPDRHRAGQHFYLCHDITAVQLAYNRGATHFMEYISGGREFRVHIAFGKSIKIAEKVGGNGYVKNRQHGWYFAYPQNFDHKITLRDVARQAVESLGLDFGAVDVIYKDGQYYVLEVNTAPALTSQSDTLSRYVRAFMEEQC